MELCTGGAPLWLAVRCLTLLKVTWSWQIGHLWDRNLRAEETSLLSWTASMTSLSLKLRPSIVIRDRNMAAWFGGRWVAIWRGTGDWVQLKLIGTNLIQSSSPWSSLVQLLVLNEVSEYRCPALIHVLVWNSWCVLIGWSHYADLHWTLCLVLKLPFCCWEGLRLHLQGSGPHESNHTPVLSRDQLMPWCVLNSSSSFNQSDGSSNLGSNEWNKVWERSMREMLIFM